MVRFAVPGQNTDPLSYSDDRLATVPVVNAPRRPTVNDKKFPMWCEWRVNKEASAPATQGEFWKLVRFESNGDATWVQFGGGGGTGPLISVETDDGTPNVVPDASGEIEILGGAGISVTGQGPGNTVTIALSGGGVAVDQINVDFNTAPGTDPVVPSASGEVSILGNVVANATNANSPIATHSRDVNALNIDLQVAAAVAATPGDAFDAGICSFDSAMFTVDANGFVQLSGGGLAIDEINVDANTAPGTDPVLPNGSGQITVSGAAVSAHSVPVETHSRAANAYNIEVQVASDRTGAPGNTNDAGICSFDDTSFVVDADGYVSFVGGGGGPTLTLTGDDSTAISPNGSGNINFTGEAVANATNAKPLYFDGDVGTSTLNAEIQVATTIGSAPADKNDAGICSFDDTSFTVDANGFVQMSSGATGNWIYVDSAAASSSSSIDFTNLSTDVMYVIVIDNLTPTTGGTSLYLRTSSNNGSSYDSGATDYVYAQNATSTSGNLPIGGQSSGISLWGATGESNGIVWLYRPSTSVVTCITANAIQVNSSLPDAIKTAGFRNSATAVDAIRFIMGSGTTIATGNFTLYKVTV